MTAIPPSGSQPMEPTGTPSSLQPIIPTAEEQQGYDTLTPMITESICNIQGAEKISDDEVDLAGTEKIHLYSQKLSDAKETFQTSPKEGLQQLRDLLTELRDLLTELQDQGY